MKRKRYQKCDVCEKKGRDVCGRKIIKGGVGHCSSALFVVGVVCWCRLLIFILVHNRGEKIKKTKGVA
jgi:hypothetical protein